MDQLVLSTDGSDCDMIPSHGVNPSVRPGAARIDGLFQDDRPSHTVLVLPLIIERALHVIFDRIDGPIECLRVLLIGHHRASHQHEYRRGEADKSHRIPSAVVAAERRHDDDESDHEACDSDKEHPRILPVVLFVERGL